MINNSIRKMVEEVKLDDLREKNQKKERRVSYSVVRVLNVIFFMIGFIVGLILK